MEAEHLPPALCGLPEDGGPPDFPRIAFAESIAGGAAGVRATRLGRLRLPAAGFALPPHLRVSAKKKRLLRLL